MVTAPFADSPQEGATMFRPTFTLHWPTASPGSAKAMARVAIERAFFFWFMRWSFFVFAGPRFLHGPTRCQGPIPSIHRRIAQFAGRTNRTKRGGCHRDGLGL